MQIGHLEVDIHSGSKCAQVVQSLHLQIFRMISFKVTSCLSVHISAVFTLSLFPHLHFYLSLFLSLHLDTHF